MPSLAPPFAHAAHCALLNAPYELTIHAGDTIDGKTRVGVGDPRVDQRVLSVPMQNVNGKLLVPVVEFMELFGRRVSVE